MNYKGDKGMFRRALANAGFVHESKSIIFNDLHRATPTRRLKLWFADGINKASQERQKELEFCLKQTFGDRYIHGYFVGHIRSYAAPKYAALNIVLRA